MPIAPYNSQTFVAFLDISGFKELMKQNDRALKALNRLYQIGYDTINNGAGIEGLFVSDCGVLFVRDTDDPYADLIRLVNGIKQINRKLLEDDFMTVTSITYGQFKYQDKLEIQGIEKNAIYGGAYVDSFLDVEKSEPKIRAGQLRIVIKNLPQAVTEKIENKIDDNARLFVKKGKHYYYYWSIENHEEIEQFERRYNDSYKLVYQGILTALKGN